MKFLALSAALFLACGKGGDENLGLSSRPAVEAAIDLAGIARPGALEAALAVPAAIVDKRLGPHARTQTLALTLASGDSKESFDERWQSELDAGGHVHLLHETSRDQGMEYLALDGKLFVRPRHARWVGRDAEGDEVERLQATHAGTLGGELAVLGRFAARAEAATTVGGRSAVRVRLSRAPSPAAWKSDGEAAHAWRASLAVSALEGEAVIDAASGALLSAKLDASYRFTRDGKQVDVTLAYRSETHVGATAAIAAPDDALASLKRPRPMVDRATLLEGLVPGVESKRE